VERDGLQCAFVGEDGRRCTETAFLEIHHVEAWARGGANTCSNGKVFCRAHNAHEAVREFGAEHMERCVRGQLEIFG
jgi:hypothetical protein